MKKPHEQEWKQGSNDKFTIRDETGRLVACVYTDDMGREEAYAIGQAISANPDMSRALLALGHVDAETGDWHLYSCRLELVGGPLVACCAECMAARDALKKAGVL